MEGLFEMVFACDILKLMSDRETGYSPLHAESNWDVTTDVMFAYAHEKINILLSVLSMFFFLFMILTYIHKIF